MAELSIEQAFDLALQHHQTGRLQEAESLCLRILQVRPAHFDSLHLLGLIAHQVGRNGVAVDLISQAIGIDPRFPQAYVNLANILRVMGRIDEAIAAAQQAISLDSRLPEAHLNLGNAFMDGRRADEAINAYRMAIALKPDYADAYSNLGNALRDRGRLDEAVDACRAAIRLRPDFAGAYNNLGNVLIGKRQHEEAIAAYRQAIGYSPSYAEAHRNLGNALKELGRLNEAIAACRQAVALSPGLPEAQFHLGNALRAAGEIDQAIASYRTAIAIDPNLPEVHVNLSIALTDEGQLIESIAAAQRAIALRPGYAEAHGNLGNAFFSNGQLDEAIAAYRRAIALRPDYADALGNLGNALKERGQLDEAITVYGRAIQLKPNFADAYTNLGNALKDKGQLDDALAAYRRAMAVNPNLAEAHSNLLFALQYHPAYDIQSLAEEHRIWNAKHAEPLRQAAQDASAGIQAHNNDRSPNRRLRIGYVSPDFREHCQALFTVGLISHHDVEQFEIFCYSSVNRPDQITRWIAGCTDCWRDVTGMPDAELAGVIRQDRIDILVDLTMHMSNARPLLFARKPAPVQVTWLAYPGTTGLSAMDYRLTDPYLDPPGENDQYYAEQSIRLPETFWCYNPLTVEPAVNSVPALERGYVTFGCLNNFCKVNDETIALWAQVMRQVENSRLLLMAPLGAIRPSVLERFARHKIAAARIEFVPYQPRQQYLETYHRIDIGLDTFPYNGHTTSLDSLWMGVPVATRIGTRAAARAGWCQLSNLGLEELAGGNSQEFVRIAADLAADLPRLARLRGSLRRRMEQSPLMDAPRFARNMEAAYRRMWQAWCRTAEAGEGGELETIPLSG
jgi:predicted O-linked N-acetylglucosamine transferase (SPINDLY family)